MVRCRYPDCGGVDGERPSGFSRPRGDAAPPNAESSAFISPADLRLNFGLGFGRRKRKKLAWALAGRIQAVRHRRWEKWASWT